MNTTATYDDKRRAKRTDTTCEWCGLTDDDGAELWIYGVYDGNYFGGQWFWSSPFCGDECRNEARDGVA